MGLPQRSQIIFENYYNMEDFNEQLHIEQTEQKRIAGIRAETINYVSNLIENSAVWPGKGGR
jgi:hypothetical protein